MWEIESFSGGERFLITHVPTPVPGALLLLGTGLGLLVFGKSRKTARKEL
jgi:hypothetical protein